MMRLQADAKTSSEVAPLLTLSDQVNQGKKGGYRGACNRRGLHAWYNEPLSKWLTVQVPSECGAKS